MSDRRARVAIVPSPDVTELRTWLNAFERRLRVLEARSTGRPYVPDARDRALLVALAQRIGAAQFVAADLVRHARVDRVLRAALREADLLNPKQIGRWLRRMRDQRIDGRSIRAVEISRRPAHRT